MVIFVIVFPKNCLENEFYFYNFLYFSFESIFCLWVQDYKNKTIWLLCSVYDVLYSSINSTNAMLMRKRMCFCLFDLKGIDVAIKFILISEKNTLNHSICLLGGGEGKRGSEKSANLLYKIRKHWIKISFSY